MKSKFWYYTALFTVWLREKVLGVETVLRRVTDLAHDRYLAAAMEDARKTASHEPH